MIVHKVMDDLPEFHLHQDQIKHLRNLHLADPLFDKSKRIDVLLGAEFFYDIINGNKLSSSNKAYPVALESTFGWLIGGGFRSPTHIKSLPHVFHTQTSDKDSVMNDSLDAVLKKFWELETMPASDKPNWSSIDQVCEDLFLNSFTRDTTGKFIVKYPMKDDHVPLGNSLQIAIQRFYQVEKRLVKHPLYYHEYKKFMQEYQALNHMEEVVPPTSASGFRCYIPHHFVLKESSTTTKFRVVFDASSKTSNGKSLNDMMHVGPTIQDSLADLMMRFRTKAVAVTADIEKMYRQIWIAEEHQKYQHIIWREDPGLPLKHFKLKTVTYGTAAAPWLAQRTLKLLADLEGQAFPLAAQVLRTDFYMDDLISGADDEISALRLQEDIRKLLMLGGFPLRKFTSNLEKVLEALPSSLRETQSLLTWDDTSHIHTLGLAWNPKSDMLMVKTPTYPPHDKPFTKRRILSEIAQLFDPLGWYTPVIITAKIIMQDIWKSSIAWDDQVPAAINARWVSFRSEIHHLQDIEIPRYQLETSSSNILFGFSDASESAYAASVYLYSLPEEGKPKLSLVTAKSRVSPIKTQSLPRLELCGSVLLSELVKSVRKSIVLPDQTTYCFTDSTLVLGWLHAEPYRFHTFVANRIAKVQDHKDLKWFHVAGHFNPADVGSRGIMPSALRHHKLWWDGPPTDFFRQFHDGKLTMQGIEEPEEERRKERVQITKTLPLQDIFHKYGALSKLTRVTAVMLRFIERLKTRLGFHKGIPSSGPLHPQELNRALQRLIIIAQASTYQREIKGLTSDTLDKKNHLRCLNPFLDHLGILRVGGRLRYSAVPDEQKFPILLPKNHKLTELIFREAHATTLHGGPQSVLSYIQRKYWVIRGKDLIRRIIMECAICIKQKAITMTQQMSALPSFRVNPAPPFFHCGVDYAGPISTRALLPRSKITLKSYIAIFICCFTKAIHVEVVSDASTEAFLQAFKRFVSRRGKPGHMYSDQGTNFQGVNNQLKELYAMMNQDQHKDAISTHCANQQIVWHFNPPSSPHFGGLWEAAVKSMKKHLYAIAGTTRFTYEGLTTLLAQIEAILNSRPLWPESSDPSDLRALTPGHFLIGRPLIALPAEDFVNTPTNRLKYHQLIQQMTQHFWKRWKHEYLNTLQQRNKWTSVQPPIKEGQLVFVKDDHLPPQQWTMARVQQVHPSPDNNIRTVTIITNKGSYVRPIVKLCPLPIE